MPDFPDAHNSGFVKFYYWTGALGQLGDVVSRVGHYAPEAIASLKMAVLNRFSDRDGGNQP